LMHVKILFLFKFISLKYKKEKKYNQHLNPEKFWTEFWYKLNLIQAE